MKQEKQASSEIKKSKRNSRKESDKMNKWRDNTSTTQSTNSQPANSDDIIHQKKIAKAYNLGSSQKNCE